MLRVGPLTVLGGVEGLSFVQTKHANHSLDWPDIEFHFISGSTSSDGGAQIRKVHGLSDKVNVQMILFNAIFDCIRFQTWYGMFQQLAYKDCWSVLPMLLRPESTGYIKLRSKNPFNHPYIVPNYLTHPLDVKTVVEGTWKILL